MRRRLVLISIPLVALVLFGRYCGSLLVVERPAISDAILVLAGDNNDARFWKGVELLGRGYGQVMFVDAQVNKVNWGQSDARLAQDFIERNAVGPAGRVKVCPITGRSTNEESREAIRCLREAGARRVLLVTSDYHTRRALSVFATRHPDLQWSVAAATDSTIFGRQWWRRREWAKVTLGEWERLVWWLCVDRWRK